MNIRPRPLEVRIVLCLLLGGYTSDEIARMLCTDRFTVSRVVGGLERRRMVRVNGTTSDRHPKKKWPARIHELTRAGRQWAEEIIQ